MKTMNDMKPFLLIIFLILGSKVCYSQNQDIESEILEITKNYNQAWESLVTDTISKYHANDIIYYWRGSKGPTSKIEFESFLNQILPTMSVYKHKMLNPQVQVLGNDVVVVSHVADAEYVDNNGKTTNYDGALTYIFHRINGEWKIVLIHESAPVSD